jgi:membrane protein insertase Oxa1/YidC/SpoIIIJ
MRNAKPELDAIKKENERLKLIGANQLLKNENNMKMMAVFKKHQTNPFAVIYAIIPFPFQIGSFFAMKEMADKAVPGMRFLSLIEVLEELVG